MVERVGIKKNLGRDSCMASLLCVTAGIEGVEGACMASGGDCTVLEFYKISSGLGDIIICTLVC